MEAREVSITPRHGHGHGTLGRSSNSAPTSGERARVERLEKKSRNQQRARMERGPQAAGWCADGGAGWQAGFGGLWACWRCVMRGARVHLCVGQPGWSQSAGALAMRAAGRLCRRARCELGRRRCGMAAVVRGPSVSRRRGAGRAAEAERSGATAWSPGCRWGVAGARWVRRAARGRCVGEGQPGRLGRRRCWRGICKKRRCALAGLQAQTDVGAAHVQLAGRAGLCASRRRDRVCVVEVGQVYAGAILARWRAKAAAGGRFVCCVGGRRRRAEASDQQFAPTAGLHVCMEVCRHVHERRTTTGGRPQQQRRTHSPAMPPCAALPLSP